MSHRTTFLLVCGLFCLSGLCNGMIDVLNKHFQNSLQVTKAQSAFVQGFWYAGYFFLALAPVPELHAAQATPAAGTGSHDEKPLFREWHFVLAIGSRFLYCAAQIGIFSFFINYLKDPACVPALPVWLAELLPPDMKYLRDGVWHLTDYCAGTLLSAAFICFTVGRFSGSALLRFAPAHRVLGCCALANVLLLGLVCLGLGWISVGALMLSFFFMSIMYPTHFALAIRGLGERTKLASSWMVTAILGGALMPMLMGWLADHYSMRTGFLLPWVCFVGIMIYGFGWRRLYRHDLDRHGY